jgi:hypothetical protein
MAESENTSGESTRWVWDFYPFSRNAWSTRKMQVEIQKVGHEVVMVSLGFGSRNEGGIKSSSHKLYAPTDSELVVVGPFCIDGEQGKPNWNSVAAYLVEAGADPGTIEQLSVVIILALLRKTLSGRRSEDSRAKIENAQDKYDAKGATNDAEDKKNVHLRLAVGAIIAVSSAAYIISDMSGHWDEWWVKFILVPAFIMACCYLSFALLREILKCRSTTAILAAIVIAVVLATAIRLAYLFTNRHVVYH